MYILKNSRKQPFIHIKGINTDRLKPALRDSLAELVLRSDMNIMIANILIAHEAGEVWFFYLNSALSFRSEYQTPMLAPTFGGFAPGTYSNNINVGAHI